jgi:hypothetical protein
MFPTSYDELVTAARELTFPVVAKNVAPWTRLTAPVVPSTTFIGSESELLTRFADRTDFSGLLLQEFVPHDSAEDWFVHIYCDADWTGRLSLTGRKAYAWPPGRGVTTDARSVPNPELAELALRFCREVGYRGIADMDWRYDRRDGNYKLVDFNPRIGAQFRYGRTTDGLDVVRALHLDVTGRPLPQGEQDFNRRMVVEHLYVPSRMLHKPSRLPAGLPVPPGTRTHGAWLDDRDPLPAAVAAVRFAGAASVSLSKYLSSAVRTRFTRRRAVAENTDRPVAETQRVG